MASSFFHFLPVSKPGHTISVKHVHTNKSPRAHTAYLNKESTKKKSPIFIIPRKFLLNSKTNLFITTTKKGYNFTRNIFHHRSSALQHSSPGHKSKALRAGGTASNLRQVSLYFAPEHCPAISPVDGTPTHYCL